MNGNKTPTWNPGTGSFTVLPNIKEIGDGVYGNKTPTWNPGTGLYTALQPGEEIGDSTENTTPAYSLS